MVRTRQPVRDLIPPEDLLGAYARGYFPMAEARDDPEVFWMNPEIRGVFPLDAFHLPRRLARAMRSTPWRFTVDSAFPDVIAACAETVRQGGKTWISGLIERSYCRLHELGHAHSVEVFDGDRLVGGLYGVSLGAAFFGESMFSREKDASKMALAHLVARLKAGRYRLLDTQFVTEHLMQFGAAQVTRARYQRQLKAALDSEGDFYVLGGTGAAVLAGTVLQLTTQMS